MDIGVSPTPRPLSCFISWLLGVTTLYLYIDSPSRLDPLIEPVFTFFPSSVGNKEAETGQRERKEKPGQKEIVAGGFPHQTEASNSKLLPGQSVWDSPRSDGMEIPNHPTPFSFLKPPQPRTGEYLFGGEGKKGRWEVLSPPKYVGKYIGQRAELCSVSLISYIASYVR